MKRICIVIPEGLPVPAVRGGAIETLIQQVIDINELEKKSYFTIICSEDQNAVKLSQEYKYTDFFFIPYKEKSKIQHLKELACRVIKKIAHIEAYSKPRYMKIVENYILDNQSKFDYVINESYSLLGMKRISDILGKKRMVAHLHCYVKATEKLESIYGTIVTVSDYIKKKWLETAKNTSTKVIVVKNGINQKKFQCEVSQNQINEIQKQLDIREDDFVVLYCGRIVPQKGVKELIEAILRINNKKIKLLIIGSPKFGLKVKSSYMDRIKQYVEEYPDIIKFTGFIHNTELYKYYALSNVSVIPSTYEDPAPLVPIEGMANGIPLIVSNTGGAWEYVSDECALQVIKENNLVDQIADSIVNLMNNADKQQMMRISAKNRAKLFTSDQFYADFIEMLNGLDKRL